jgi:hypothetical protein
MLIVWAMLGFSFRSGADTEAILQATPVIEEPKSGIHTMKIATMLTGLSA